MSSTTKTRMAAGLPVVAFLALGSCYIGERFSRINIVKEERPSFTLDAGRPFVVELGRGSGWDGLDIVQVDETGTAWMQRRTSRLVEDVIQIRQEEAILPLPEAKKLTIVEKVNDLKLTTMARSYSDPVIADGTQWVLWIQQGSSGKSVYLDNVFPAPFKEFAGFLDEVLKEAGQASVTWKPLPVNERSTPQEKLLWSRIRRPGAVMLPNSGGG